MDPATLIAAASVMLPVLPELPIVRSLPAVVELIAVLTVTAKLLVLPTMVSDPLARAVLISETFTVEVAVTVSVPELIDQPEGELPAVEMVRVCPTALPVTHTEASMHHTDFLPIAYHPLILHCLKPSIHQANSR